MNLKRRRRRRFLLLGLMLLLLAAVLLVRFRYLPLVRTLVSVKIENETSNIIVEAIDEQIDSGNIRYDRIITLQTDAQGHVTALETEMSEVNRLKMELLRSIGGKIREMTVAELSVPLGNVLAPSLLSGHGGYVPVRVVEFQSSGAEFESSFTQAGINQTLHQISLRLGVTVSALTPAGLLTVPVSVEMVVAQTVIVGEVPQTVISITGE